MSAPAVEYKQANLLSYGFLAARAEKAAQLLRKGELVSGHDTQALREAAGFLKKVSSGVNFLLTTGDFQSNDLVGALEALHLAIDPIQRIASQLQDNKEFADLFSNIADAVLRRIDNANTAPTEDEDLRLQLFQAFFDALYQFVSTELERHSPAIGSLDKGDPFRPLSA